MSETLELQSHQRKSRKAPAIQTAVVAKYLTGESKSQISRDLGIAHNTVTAILSAQEINEQVKIGRSRAALLIPRSLDVAEYRLSKNDGSMALGILRGTKVLVNEQLTQVSGGLFLANIPAEWMQGWEKQAEAGESTTTNGSDAKPNPDIDLTPLSSTET